MKSYYLLTLHHAKSIGNIAKEIAKEMTCECFLGKEISLIEVQQHELVTPKPKTPNLKGRNAKLKGSTTSMITKLTLGGKQKWLS